MKWLVLLTFMAVKMKFTKLNGSCNILPKSMKWVKVLSKNLDCIRVLNSIYGQVDWMEKYEIL